jgi:hypothetical protein
VKRFINPYAADPVLDPLRDRLRDIPALMARMRHSAEMHFGQRDLSPGQLSQHVDARVELMLRRLAGFLQFSKPLSFRRLLLAALEEATERARTFEESHDRPVGPVYETRRMLVFRQRLVGFNRDDEPRLVFTGILKRSWVGKWRGAWAMVCESLDLIEECEGLLARQNEPANQRLDWELIQCLRQHVSPRLRFYARREGQFKLEKLVQRAYELHLVGRDDEIEEPFVEADQDVRAGDRAGAGTAEDGSEDSDPAQDGSASG